MNSKPKSCPLLCIAFPKEVGSWGSSQVDCLEEDCAWYLPQAETCAIPYFVQLADNGCIQVDAGVK
jgi:hypothetical protein